MHYRSAWALGCHTRIRAGFHRELPVDRSMARDRPSPYGPGGRFVKKMARYRSAGACPPRSLGYADDGEGQALALRKGAAFFHRSAGALGGFHTRIRAGFPREPARVPLQLLQFRNNFRRS